MKQSTEKCPALSLPKRHLVKKSKGVCGNVHLGSSSTQRELTQGSSPKIISLSSCKRGVLHHETPLAERLPSGKYLPALRKGRSCKAATSIDALSVPFPMFTPAVDVFSSNPGRLYCSDSSTSDEVDQFNVYQRQSCCSIVNA